MAVAQPQFRAADRQQRTTPQPHAGRAAAPQLEAASQPQLAAASQPLLAAAQPQLRVELQQWFLKINFERQQLEAPQLDSAAQPQLGALAQPQLAAIGQPWGPQSQPLLAELLAKAMLEVAALVSAAARTKQAVATSDNRHMRDFITRTPLPGQAGMRYESILHPIQDSFDAITIS
ncbi:MAG: hypothetical protein O2960_29420 [Verrucomicrobia bacterium]|nr:hypothetical protein [Verrucomicrobiota bacterium]